MFSDFLNEWISVSCDVNYMRPCLLHNPLQEAEIKLYLLILNCSTHSGLFIPDHGCNPSHSLQEN